MSLEERELSPEAMERVIAATKLNGDAIERKKLAYDLGLHLDICQTGREVFSPSVTNRAKYKLDQICKSAQKLQKQMADEKIYQMILYELDDSDDPHDAISGLVVAVQAAIKRRTPQQNADAALFLDQSVFELFVGVSLPKIYKKHSEREAGTSRIGNDVDGPFIRFAYQALIELGFKKKDKPYSRESLREAG